MTDTVTTRNQRREFCPLPFRGFISTGYCFARADLHDGKLTVLCSQLPDYRGTSVTNAVEAVMDSLVAHLMQPGGGYAEPAIEVVPAFKLLRTFINSLETLKARDFATAKAYVLRNCQWIEHYPATTGLSERESYALVSFSDSGSPAWRYMPRGMIEQQIPDPPFLTVNPGTTATWKSSLPPSN